MKRRTIKEAVIEALKQNSTPLSVRAIYNYIIEQDLYRFNAINPENIVKTEIRRHSEGIEFPTAHPKKYFQALQDGKYWIAGVPVPGQTKEQLKVENKQKKDFENLKNIVHELKAIHTKHNSALKQQILNQLQEMPPEMFELFSKKLLDIYGFRKMKVTSYVKDGGIDGYGELKVGITHLNVAFQSKRWKNHSVSRVEIDKFRGAIQGEYEQGIIFTTSKFTKEALNATRRPGAVPIILIDGESIVDIMIEKRFGVEYENIPVFINTLDSVLGEDID